MKITPASVRSRIEELIQERDYQKVLDFDQTLDKFFNLNRAEKPSSQNDENQYWGLDRTALLTSYIDYYKMIKLIPEGSRLVDLGSGYSRGTILASYLNLLDVLSIEINEFRVQVASEALKIFSLNRGEIQCLDLEESDLPFGYAYYIYLPQGRLLDKILLSFIAKKVQKLFVCESHGDVINYIEQLGLFEHTSSINLSIPRHNSKIHIFELKRIISYPTTWRSDFSQWFLFNQQKDDYIVFKYLISEKEFHWIIPICDLEQGHNGKEWTLKDLRTGRFIDINREEKIIDLLTSDSVPVKIKENLRRGSLYKKYFLAPIISVETNHGEFREL